MVMVMVMETVVDGRVSGSWTMKSLVPHLRSEHECQVATSNNALYDIAKSRI